ncbi:head-tail connector protein [Sphingobacterium sp. InxBP1]|uniref:head-tail connector protein n=1 Tax=Sphingobacterium sp. InxBP1 TaxID=2870328 RepID=UPI002244194A|nr:head-tail connector protein [Sphingobacterium sp. InxBP1]MCW8309902.1 head-tail connector protein [Sphingobacterium sp. InxBP1]
MLNIEILEVIGAEPVTLSEAKRYCKVDDDYTEEDSLITELISSARSSIEQWANISLVEKRIKVYSDTTKTLWLPCSPVIEIEGVVDNEGHPIPFDQTIKFKVRIEQAGGYFITYRAGFKPLPTDLKIAVLKQVATDFDNRENFIINSNNQQQSGTNLANSTKNYVKPYSRNLWL